MTKRFSYRRPIGDVSGAHGLVAVWEDGAPIGHLNRTSTGYAVRDLDGKLLESVHVHDRDVAASALSRRARGVSDG